MLLQHSESCEIALSSIRFEYEGGRYFGRGLLRWNSSEGFTIDAFVERAGEPVPLEIQYGKVGVVPRSKYSSLRMRLRGGTWAYVRPIPLNDRIDLIHDRRLSLHVTSVLFMRRIPAQFRSSSMSGNLLLSSSHWPMGRDAVVKQIRLNDREIGTSYSRGIDHDDRDLRLVGQWLESKDLSLTWSLADTTACNKRRAIRLGDAIAHALMVICSSQVQILRQETQRGHIEILEMTSRREPTSLGTFRLLHNQEVLDNKLFATLIKFFESDSTESAAARQLIAVCLDASGQSLHQARELLIATVLEGVLRTVLGMPFEAANNTDSFKMVNAIASFREKYLSDQWQEQCKRAVECFRRLRHRNAHPDWLTTAGGGLSEEKVTQSIDDMIFLSSFYGYMILGMAGVPNLKPQFPIPHRQWGPLITITQTPKVHPPQPS